MCIRDRFRVAGLRLRHAQVGAQGAGEQEGALGRVADAQAGRTVQRAFAHGQPACQCFQQGALAIAAGTDQRDVPIAAQVQRDVCLLYTSRCV